jgi:Reverse transcriptase (RNA-dependent DNA polymerase)
LDIGFKPLEADPCIYKKTVRGMVNGVMKDKYYIIAIYVDNLLFACCTPQMCNELEKALMKHFKMKILRLIKHILGMEVYKTLDERKMFISQRQYIADSVNFYSKYKLHAFPTFIDNRKPNMKSHCPEAGLPEATRMLQMPYRELIGTLLWIAHGTRPNIAFAVTTLSKCTLNPREIYWQALLRLLEIYWQALLRFLEYPQVIYITAYAIPEIKSKIVVLQ